MSAIVPPALRPGDTIAIIPTARSISLEELRDGIALAENWGLRVKLGQGIGRKHFQQAGTDEDRAEDLRSALSDPEVRAIWCARGGYGTVRILDHIDLGTLKNDPKWIVGFSDITVLHNALHHLGIQSVHAQMPFNIHGKTQECKQSLEQALFGKELVVTSPRAEEHPSSLATFTGQCEGELIGGNLSILYALRGTPLDIDPSGKILFLEDLDELLYHLDRMVQNLRLGGWFKNLAGLIIGGMSDMRNKNENDPFGRNAQEIFAEALGTVPYPVCYNFPAGHIDDNRALILGANVELAVTPEGSTLKYVD